MTVIGLIGVPTSEVGALANVCVTTPGGKFDDRAQELHIKVIHILLVLLKRHFFPANYETGQAPAAVPRWTPLAPACRHAR